MRFLRLYFCAPSRVQMTNVAGTGANTSVMDYVDRVHNQSCALQSCPADAGSEAGKKCACAWPARTAPDPEKPDALDAGRVEGSIGSRFPFDLTSARAFPFNWLLTPELQWQSRGKTAYLTGVHMENAWTRRADFRPAQLKCDFQGLLPVRRRERSALRGDVGAVAPADGEAQLRRRSDAQHVPSQRYGVDCARVCRPLSPP